MTYAVALSTLEEMPEPEFQKFFKSLPQRTQLIVRGGLANWREVLPEWYIKFSKEE